MPAGFCSLHRLQKQCSIFCIISSSRKFLFSPASPAPKPWLTTTMASPQCSGGPALLSSSRNIRRKTTEACERCRERRIKVLFRSQDASLEPELTIVQCDGLQPCYQCQKKGAGCVFAVNPGAAKGNEALEKSVFPRAKFCFSC